MGSLALKILSLGGIFFSFAVVNNNILAATGNPKRVTQTILAAAILNLVMNLILIPQHRILGAAWATTLAYLLVLVLSIYFVSKIVKISIPLLDWGKTLFSGVVFLFVVDFLKNFLSMGAWIETFLVLLVGLSIYVFLLYILGIRIDLFNRKVF